MRKFDEQFMNRFMLPLLREVVTDMGKGDKNLFLNKLLKGAPLDTMDKNEFIRYYFETRQDTERKRPFAEMGEGESRVFWNKFLDGFSNYMILRYRLSGEPGARTAFCPDKEGNFSRETTNNLYYLGYRISQDFENDRIAQMVKGDAEKEKLLKEGNLKLVVTEKDGVKTEEAITENSDEVKADPELKDDFTASRKAAREQKYEQIVTNLAESGLKIEPNTFKNELGQWNFSTEQGKEGWLAGEVTDRDGNKLKVSVNPAAGADDDKKYSFTFLKGTAPNGKDLAGYSFGVSENDLKNFKNKSAFEVAQRQLPETVKEKPAAPPGVEAPKAFLPEQLAKARPGREVEVSGQLPEEITVEGEKKRPVFVPKGAKARGMPAKGAAAPIAIPKGAKITKPAPAKLPPPSTVQGRKEELAKKREQQRRAGRAPGAPAAGAAPGAERGATAAPSKRPWWKSPAVKVGAAYSGAFGGIFGMGSSMASAGKDAPSPEAVANVIYVVLHSLGINLFS